MERIGTAGNSALEALLKNETTTAITRSSPRGLTLPDQQALAAWMVRMKATYHGQEITPEMAALMREDWTELAQRHGTPVLLQALARHRASSRFLPCRADVEAQVSAVLEQRRSMREQGETKRHIAELASWKQQWEAERNLPRNEDPVHSGNGVTR